MSIETSHYLQSKDFIIAKTDIDSYVKLGIASSFFLCIFTRICLFIFQKDLWLDEAVLLHAINLSGWHELLSGKLPGSQSAPLLFVLINKGILSYSGTPTRFIYILPLMCSLISVLGFFLVSRKVGDVFYVFSVLMLFSFCFTATYYSTEFKQYSMEMCISLMLLYLAINSLDKTESELLSLRNFFIYSICVLCSSTAILFISGILCAAIIIAWRRKTLKNIYTNGWKMLLLLALIGAYYFLYLKNGNSASMKGYWKGFFIPVTWDAFLAYWKTTGIGIFQALFYSSGLTSFLLVLGLMGGSVLLFHKKREYFLLLSLPVLVTLVANFIIYPPGHPGAPRGGRLLLFLLPNGVLVIAWFYAVFLRKLASLTSAAGKNRKRIFFAPPYVLRMILPCTLCALIGVSIWANGRYLYTKEYQIQQTSELIQIMQANQTPDSLNLVYAYAQPAYKYYQKADTKPTIEILPGTHIPVLTRLKELPKNRRILLFFSHHSRVNTRDIEELFTTQRREFVKIPSKGAVLYILPKTD